MTARPALAVLALAIVAPLMVVMSTGASAASRPLATSPAPARYCAYLESGVPSSGNLFPIIASSTKTSQIQMAITAQRQYAARVMQAKAVAPTATLSADDRSLASYITRLIATETTVVSLRTSNGSHTLLNRAYATFAMIYGTFGTTLSAATALCAPYGTLTTAVLGLGGVAVSLAQHAGPSKNPTNYLRVALKSPKMIEPLSAARSSSQRWTVTASTNKSYAVCLSLPTTPRANEMSTTFGAC